MIMALGLYFHVIGGCSGLTPEGSSLDQILADRFLYNYDPMTKKELVLYYNTACPVFTLDYEENGPEMVP